MKTVAVRGSLLSRHSFWLVGLREVSEKRLSAVRRGVVVPHGYDLSIMISSKVLS